jgi:hypothetical protein
MIYGVPFIELNSKALVPLRGYGRDKTRLSFVYNVGVGEETRPGERLLMTPNTTINLNGATIRDDATDLDALLLPVPTFGEMMSPLGPSAPLPGPLPDRRYAPCLGGLRVQPRYRPGRFCQARSLAVLLYGPIRATHQPYQQMRAACRPRGQGSGIG